MFKLIVPAFLLVAAIAPAQQKKLDPCALVSKAEVQQITGHAAGDPKINAHNPSVCDFKLGLGTVGFMVAPQRPGETPDKVMAEMAKMKIPVAEAKGVGDRAFFADHGYGMIQFNAYKGPHYIIVTMMVPGAAEAKTKAMAEKLMQKALAKL